MLESKAKTDNELVTAVELANEFDPDGDRTMQIYKDLCFTTWLSC